MKIEKKITFIYLDRADYQNYIPIYEEAIRRGYEAKLTQNPFEKCEIGVYCQHNNFPEHSKFSVIMLHDIIQGYGRWPDIWFKEPWNKYDIGVLPGQTWKDLWIQSSRFFYTRPKFGVYEIGWPKADVLKKINRDELRNEIFNKNNMDLKKRTILYAPAWENDHKQDDFVKSMLKLDVNILIKQAPIDPDVSSLYKLVYDDIVEMQSLHSNIPNVTIMDPKTNIMEAIAISDVLVSEESSTMCEAVMLGIPAVSVSNWLIPDSNPKRFPSVDYNFVIKTKKEDLTKCIEKIVDNYDFYKKQSEDYSNTNFKNIGETSSIIMDIIDDYRKSGRCSKETIQPRQNGRMSMFSYFKFQDHKFKIHVINNWSKRSTVVKKMMNIYRGMKLK